MTKYLLFLLLPLFSFAEEPKVEVGIYDIPGDIYHWRIVVDIPPYLCDTKVDVKELLNNMDERIKEIVQQCRRQK